ncbi:Outer membrane autotransporter barrel [Pseudomonas synxantha]|uniref:Outer membrane autotransporter barrel n=1 Tax=Pseudomonas synxantha TaxID=47883 RepID=A0A3G7UFY7_9PSED|nr:autotransporter outer membrane beta-barrel domain-containing protein [Pseudomonas synxantha]AZE58337.1 Outer membrane autotransporter barrel [Pseudomonas synxantha]
MPFTLQRVAIVIGLAMAASFQPAHARGDIEYRPYGSHPYDAADYSGAFIPKFEAPPIPPPFDGFLTQQATSHNGLQVAKVLEPALIQLVASGELDSQDLKQLQASLDQLSKQSGGIGAALEQLAASQNANLAAATQATTQHLSRQLLATLRTLPTDNDGHFWVQGLGNSGNLDAHHGSAGLKHDTQGLLLGADWAIDHAWRVGAMGAKTSSRFDAPRYAADLDSWHLGGYAVRQDGPLALRLGGIYSNHAGQNKRSVSLLNYHDSLKGNYNASSQTLFSELGYQLGSGDSSVEPFVGLGYQRYQRDRFKESGGVTALNVGPQTQRNLNSTFGLRLATLYRFDNNMSLTPHLSTSWKHLYGDVNSQVRQTSRYAPGLIDGYTITGTALDRDSFDLQAGLDVALSTQHSLGLSYTRQAGNHGHDQGLTGQWRMSF